MVTPAALSLSLAAASRALPSRTRDHPPRLRGGLGAPSASGLASPAHVGPAALKAGRPPPQASEVRRPFHCRPDNLEGEPAKGSGEQAALGQYYAESIDAWLTPFHPQTIIAHSMNGRPLDVSGKWRALAPPGRAPARLQANAKYVQRIQLTDRLSGLYGGKGGYWEDRGYEWYAGI